MAALRYRNVRQISAFISGLRCHEYVQANNLPSSSLIPSAHTTHDIVARSACRVIHASRFSTVAARSKEASCELDLLSFVGSTFDHAEGPYHRWINRLEDKECLRKVGSYLLLAEAFLDNSQGSRGDRTVMLEKVKLLQQRYPWLQVFGFHSCSSVSSMDADHKLLMDVVMEDYISFPVLLCSKSFPEVASGACCILLKGPQNLPIYNEKDIDISILQIAIKDLNQQLVQKAGNVDKLKSPWSKKTEGFEKPYICSYLENLPLFFPGCISADDDGNRIFLSDSNHHRVIVFDSSGKILDVIGSSPGYEDGDFETAKLMRPAASWYDTLEDCLYLVDSENHAIRRADLGRRVLETLYPTTDEKVGSGLWSWVLDKLGIRQDVNMKSVDIDQASLLFPWHLLKSEDNDLFVINRSFDTLWVMDLDRGKVRDVVKGRASIMEFCGKLIMEKVSDLQGLSSDVLQQLFHRSQPLEGNMYSGFVSSFVARGKDLLICDTVGQRVLMLKKQAGVTSSMEFSNFGILGFPYWLSNSLERVFPCGSMCAEPFFDHIQSFTLFPGKIHAHVTVDIPHHTELVEPLQEHCVWRQARGAAMEVLGIETTVVTSEKVGVAQQWYDELDNLAFEAEPEVFKVENQPPRRDLQDGKIHIDCVVKTSPGTSEVIVSAPLYLKLRRSSKPGENNQDMKAAAEIADILKPHCKGSLERDTLIRLLLNLNRDLGDLVFVKPLHVKIAFDTLNHPKPENSRDIILTDATVDVDVSL